METLLMRSSFLQEKFRAARLAFTDVSESELLAEKVTNNNVLSPDTKTMTQIAEASYDFDDYWRIVDVLHKRLENIDWNKWRQSYNSLILLEFLITHGPKDFFVEFRYDIDIIKELGTFRFIDARGVNWGIYMKNKAERILELMQGGDLLEEVRSKAIKLTNEIQGFGSSSSSSTTSPRSSSSPSSSWRSSFDSYSPSSQPWHDVNYNGPNNNGDDILKQELEQNLPKTTSNKLRNNDHIFHHKTPKNFLDDGVTMSDILDWNLNQETLSEINNLYNDDHEDEKKVGFFQGICSKHVGYSPLKNTINGEKTVFRSLSDAGTEKKKMLDHQYSLGY